MAFWYAVYTSSRAEKKVKERLDSVKIENYLPLQTKIRIWNDRKKKISLPLISGYIFVKVEEEQFLTVLNVPGVVTFLKEKGKVIAIPERQIDQLRFFEENADEPMEISFEKIPEGSLVKIIRGKLMGFEGELVKICDKYKIVLRLEHLGCALMTISTSCVEKVKV